jgi:hypothetical protein
MIQPGPAPALAHPGKHHLPGKVEMGSPAVTVPLTFFGNLPIVEVTIDGKGPYKFILDTGAAGSVLSQSLVDALGLPVTGEIELGSPIGPGKIPGKMVHLQRLGVGSMVVSDLEVVATDMGSLFGGSDGPVGVLSPGIAPGILATLDYPAGRAVFSVGELPAPDGASVFEYGDDEELPSVPLTVAGVDAIAHLDSGTAGGLTLPKSFVEKLPMASPPVEIGHARTVDREFAVLGAKLNGSVKLGRYSVENPELRFIDAQDANIGYDLLRRFAVTVDAKNHRVRLEEPSGLPVQTSTAPPRKYGVRLRIEEPGVIEVDGTEPGSPAERAGLRHGDRILQLNGTRTDQLDPAQLAESLRRPSVTLVVQRDGKPLEIRMSLD